MAEKEELLEEIGEKAEFEAVASSKGGKRLIRMLQEELRGSLDALCAGYREMMLPELVSLVARISERKKMLEILVNAADDKKKLQKIYEDLTKHLQE